MPPPRRFFGASTRPVATLSSPSWCQGSIRKALASTARPWTALGPVSRTYVLLCDGEDEQRDAAAEECAGDDVREPVDLQVRATPGHADDTEAGERPPPSAVRARCREEQDERDTGRACVGGMARGERGADGVDEPIGRAGRSTSTLRSAESSGARLSATANATRASQRRRRRRSSPTSVSAMARPTPRPSQLKTSARSVSSGVSR